VNETPVVGGDVGTTISEWISTRLWVDYATPFTFEGRPYLKKIHDLNDKKILLRCGRQVEKSSSLAAKLISWSCMVQGWKSLYVSPSQGQTRVFSHSRVDRVLASPYVKAHHFDTERCLPGSAKIMLATGEEIPMSEIVKREAVGLEVMSWNGAQRRWTTGRITQIHINGKRSVGRLRLSNGMSLVCTPEHQVWTQAQRWKEAMWTGLPGALPADIRFRRVLCRPGMDQSWGEAVGWDANIGEEMVYDLSIEPNHSYVADGICVHNCTDFVYEKTLLNGSTVLLSYASTDADRVRGISADMLLCDEVQDMIADVFPVVEEVLSHAPDPYKIYAGTPKTLNNAMETHWKNSTQCEWMIFCPGCAGWIFQDEKIIQDSGPTCPKCSRGLDPQFGKWVPYGAQDSEFMGFRIPQTMVPWMMVPSKWKELVRKLRTWPQQQFYNEVLGLAHEKGANPLVNEDLKKCCRDDFLMVEARPSNRYFDAFFAGIDWGAGLGSYTVISIVGMHEGKVWVPYMRRFAAEKDEINFQVEECAKIAARFGCPLVGCDWGGGFAQNKSLAMALSGQADVIQLYESGVKKRDISYQKDSRMYTLNRSMGLSMVIQGIKHEDYVFPKWEQFQEFADDFTGIFEDYNRALRCIVYDHPDGIPDDCVHSLMFATLTMKIARGDKAL
jgi:hypothetical protein